MHRVYGIIPLLLIISQLTNAKEPECGQFREDQVLKQDDYAFPSEHQWLARITYLNGSKEKTTGCLGALISKRNVLAPAHCFVRYNGHAEAFAVQLGVWNKSRNAYEVSCESDGFCVLPPQEIKLAEIAIHPEYDALTLKNSLAVLTLARDAKLTASVMPICMPPLDLVDKSLVGQIFILAGLRTNKELKHKTWVNTISTSLCQNSAKSLVTRINTVCGYQEKDQTYYPGSSLVGIQVRNDVPQNYYLVGLLHDWTNVDGRILSSFLNIQPYMNFIRSNSDSLIERH
ncbi:CLIP domain-containing serine protease B9 [Drosophila tropicalis]|uniref:CLIP domain-containing serine protease B9 n=1 Tax=Drosophila tropicalis TaxID=46794 RepID=UPI0035ABBAEA